MARQRPGRLLAVRRAPEGDQPLTTRTLLRGGLVADGIGTTTVLADVLIDGQVIASVGPAGTRPAVT